MADLNSNVTSSITIASGGVGSAGFGIPLWASTEPSFAERTRTYLSAAEAAADATLDADSIDAVAAAFAQSPRVDSVKVGRLDTPTAQVDSIVIGGSPATGDKFSIVVGGVTYEVTVGATETAEAVAILLRAALAADPLMTVSGNTVNVILTGKVLGATTVVTVAKTSVAGTIVDTATPATNPIGASLTAILTEDEDWFGFAIYSKVEGQILLAAAWAESNYRLFMACTADAGVLTSGTTDIAYQLKALTYAWTAILFNDGSDEYADFALLSKKLSADPDTESTIWKYATLAGVVVTDMSSTEMGYALGKNCNVYLDFFGVGGIADGKTANGLQLDLLVAKAWTEARIRERAASLLLEMTNTNRKVPFTDAGITQFASVVEGVLADGVTAGHFVEGTALVSAPRASAVSGADKAARRLGVPWSVGLAGAIESITYTGILYIDT